MAQRAYPYVRKKVPCDQGGWARFDRYWIKVLANNERHGKKRGHNILDIEDAAWVSVQNPDLILRINP
jgi:hypothetical protein